MSSPTVLPTMGDVLKQITSVQFIGSIAAFVVITIIMAVMNVNANWYLLSVYGCLLIALSNVATTSKTFFKGGVDDNSKDTSSFTLLATSTMISWVFAKSIKNSSILSALFGITGGWAYAAWYLSLPATAIVVFKLRMKGYQSLPQMIYERYGPWSLLTFCLCLGYRLYNEVWSNSMVVSSFYGTRGEGGSESNQWWTSNLISTGIPLVYVMMGGLKSSLFSDMLQGIFAMVLLVTVLSAITIQKSNNTNLNNYIEEYHNDRTWSGYSPWDDNTSVLSLKGGMDLLATGILQGCTSYPFFDPVLTDRAFLTHPKTMARALVVGGLMAGLFIMLFGFIGIYGNMLGQCIEDGFCDDSNLKGADLTSVRKGYPEAVAQTLGDGLYTLVNLIMMSSSISTLDSTFASTAKLVGPDMAGVWDFLAGALAGVTTPGSDTADPEDFAVEMAAGVLTGVTIPETKNILPIPTSQATDRHVFIGRVGMVIMAVIGTLPLLENPTELDATTVSGTMIVGLGAPIYMVALLPDDWLWKRGTKRPLAFLMSFYACAAIGICYQLKYKAKNSAGNLKYSHLDIDFSPLTLGNGYYGMLLGINVASACLSLGLWSVFAFNDWCWCNDGADEITFEAEREILTNPGNKMSLVSSELVPMGEVPLGEIAENNPEEKEERESEV